MKYYITKDCENGDKEVVQRIDGTLEEAREAFMQVLEEQSKAYHIDKTLKQWRVIRLFDSNDTLLLQES